MEVLSTKPSDANAESQSPSMGCIRDSFEAHPEVGNAGRPLFVACAVPQGFNDGATDRGGAGLALPHQIF